MQRRAKLALGLRAGFVRTIRVVGFEVVCRSVSIGTLIHTSIPRRQPMFDHTHYVPILKGKEGEYQALSELTPTIKSKLTPLIEPIPIPYDFANEIPAKTVDEHLENFVSKIVLNWGLDPIFFDLDWIL